MKLLDRLRAILEPVLLRSRLERTLDEELRFHQASRADALVATGLSRADAEARARREFGDDLRWK